MTNDTIEMPLKFLRWALLALIVVFIACQLFEVRRARTIRGDETLYIQAAYTMLESGDWLTPRYEPKNPQDPGELRFMKPFLPYWIVLIPMRLFGLSLTVVRLPSVLLALAALPFVYGLARLLVRDGTAALLAVAAYLSTEAVYANAHQARTDSLLAFCVIGAMYFFARLIFEGGHERRDALLAYAFVAFALVTKGMVGIVFILVPVAVFLAISWKTAGRQRWRALMSPWGWALLLLITVPWYAVMLARHGHVFTDMFLNDQVSENVRGTKWYILSNVFEYLWLLVKDCLPWSVPAALALVANDGGIRATFKERRAEWLFLLCWLGVTYVVCLFGNVVRDRYLLPALPAFAVLAGLAAAKAGAAGARARGFKWGLYIVALGAFLMGFGFLVHNGLRVHFRLNPDGVEMVLGMALIGGAWAVFLLASSQCLLQAALCSGALMMAALLSVTAFFTAPAPIETGEALARALNEPLINVGSCMIKPHLAHHLSHAQIVTVGLSKHVRAAMLLSGGRRVYGLTDSNKPAEQAQRLREFMQEPGERLVAIDSRDYQALPEGLQKSFTIVGVAAGAEERDFPKWLHSQPRLLADLIRGTRQELYLLLAGN